MPMPRHGKAIPGRWEWLPDQPRATFTAKALLLLVVATAFAPGLWAGFLYDDRRDILLNPAARAESFFASLPNTLRPLLKASYALQDATTGMSALAFHAANLALHLGAVLLVLALVRRACLSAGMAGPMAERTAWCATFLWAVHPALTDTVSYASGRSTGLSSVLAMGCLLAATANRPSRPLAFGLALLAPLARETALITPLLLVVWQITVGPAEGRGQMLRRAAPVWLGTLGAALVIAAMARHRELVAFSLDQRPPIEALRANIFAIPEILRLWVQPTRLGILPAQPVVHGWGEVPTLLRGAGFALVIGAAVALRRCHAVASLAVLWTLVVLLPGNSVIWRVDPVAVRPLYLAGIGVSMLSALVIARLRFAPFLVAALALGLGGMTVLRAGLYTDEVALFADAVQRAPDDARARTMLGLVLANAGRPEAARAALEQALALDPFAHDARNALRLLDAAPSIYSNGPP